MGHEIEDEIGLLGERSIARETGEAIDQETENDRQYPAALSKPAPVRLPHLRLHRLNAAGGLDRTLAHALALPTGEPNNLCRLKKSLSAV